MSGKSELKVDVVEVMARALCFVGDHCRRHCADFDHRPCPDAPYQWGEQARATHAALEKQGLVVVPKDDSPSSPS